MMIAAAVNPSPPLSLLDDGRKPDWKWFSGGGCVVPDADKRLVFVRGTLVGRFDGRDRGPRNVVLMALAADAKMHLGQLAEAFDLSSEALRLMRRVYETEGMAPLLDRTPGGGESRVKPALLQRLEELFDNGATVSDALAKVSKKYRTSRGTVGRIRLAWQQARKKSLESHPRPAERPASQLSLVPPPAAAAGGGETPPMTAVGNDSPPGPPTAPVDASASAADSVSLVSPRPEATASAGASATAEEKPLLEPAVPPVEAGASEAASAARSEEVKTARSVQHLGTWLLIAVTHQLGLYRHATQAAGTRVEKGALRLAIDAMVAALAVGQRCAEGVRRLATSTCTALLLASGAPSSTWTRRVLGQLAAADGDGISGGATVHLLMAREYLAAAGDNSASAGPVFYVDNHMRPYTGKHDLRRGWRMQDKRALPGVSDYYVHDEDGRPVARFAIPSHDSLTKWLSPIAHLLRLGLGEELKDKSKRVLVAFDRAGAFPEQMARLRDEDFEFVTYERAPYRTLPAAAFTEMRIPSDSITYSDATRSPIPISLDHPFRSDSITPERWRRRDVYCA